MAIVTNIPQDAGSVTVTTDRGGLQLTIAKDAVYGDFNGRQIMASDDLRVGARTFASYNTVQESSPGTGSGRSGRCRSVTRNRRCCIHHRKVNTSHGGARPDTGVSFLAQKRTGGVRFFFIYFLRLRLILLC